jgi:hypothetical protein
MFPNLPAGYLSVNRYYFMFNKKLEMQAGKLQGPIWDTLVDHMNYSISAYHTGPTLCLDHSSCAQNRSSVHPAKTQKN